MSNQPQEFQENEAGGGISAIGFPIQEYLSKAQDGLSRAQLNLNKVTEAVKTTFRKNNAMKVMQWREQFSFSPDISFLEQNLMNFGESITRAQKESPKYQYASSLRSPQFPFNVSRYTNFLTQQSDEDNNPRQQSSMFQPLSSQSSRLDSLPSFPQMASSLQNSLSISQSISLDDIYGNTNVRFSKDIGLLRKKNKLGIVGIFGAENVLEKYGRVSACAWKSLHDPVNEEVNMKCNVFYPTLAVDGHRTANWQVKYRQQYLTLDNSESLLATKYQVINEVAADEFQDVFTQRKPQRTIYSFLAKIYLLERINSQPSSLVLGVNRHQMHRQAEMNQAKDVTWAADAKYGVYFHSHPSAVLVKAQYSCVAQKFFAFEFPFQRNSKDQVNNKSSTIDWQKLKLSKEKAKKENPIFFNMENRFNGAYVAGLGRFTPYCEKLSANYQPGYASDLLDNRNSGLAVSAQNTLKLELYEFVRYVSPFVQLHGSVQSKTLANFAIDAEIRAVASAGLALDLGISKIQVLYNFIDLVPLLSKKRQDASFQNFQIQFSA